MRWTEEQLPEKAAVFLDHIGFFVNDINAAGTRLERLGFTVHPVSIHYNEGSNGELALSGTANRLVTFGIGYLEVLSAVADTPLSTQLRSSLDRYEGLHLIALTHEHVAGRDAHFAEMGFAMQPTVQLRRSLDTGDGAAQVKATVARCEPGVMEEGRAQMLTHDTPELIWLPGFSGHMNGADALVEMLVVSADPRDAASRYSRFSGCPASESGGRHHVDLDRGRLTFVDDDSGHRTLPLTDLPGCPYCAGVVLRTSGLDRTRAALSAENVTPLVDHRDLICVGPTDALGSYMIFTQDIDDDVWSTLEACLK